MSPLTPRKMKMACQPKAIMIAVRIGGATAGPHFEPLSQMAVAWPRSARGNQSAVSLAEAGPLGASVMPSSTRNVMKCQSVVPTAISAAAMLHVAIARKYMRRAPSLSTSQPAGSWQKA